MDQAAPRNPVLVTGATGSIGGRLVPRLLEPEAAGTRLTQTARFLPRGLPGLAYWYAVLPLHGIVFRGMLEGVRRAATGLPVRSSPAS